MSTNACGMPANACSSALNIGLASMLPSGEPGAGWSAPGTPPLAQSNKRYSSGPNQSVARVAWAFARQASSENAGPHTGCAAARAAAAPWKAKRAADGSAFSQAAPGTAGARRVAGSTIDACSGGVVDNRRSHFNLEVAARHGYIDCLSNFRAPACDQCQRDGIPQHAAGIGRGHVADEFHRRPLTRLGGDLRTFFERDAGTTRAQSDQLFAVRGLHRLALQRALADEIRFGLADRPRETGIVRRHGAIGVLTHDDVTLLGTQYVHGLSAVLHHPMPLAGRVNRFPYRRAKIGGHIDFETQLAGKADAEQQHGDAANEPAAHAHMRHGRCAEIDAFDQGLEHSASARSLHGDHGPLLGGRGEPYLEVRPFGLTIVFHHGQHPRCAANNSDYMEAIVAQARDHAVVVDESVIAAEDSIARASRT